MPIQKVKLSGLKITNTDGEFGPQKKIFFKQFLEEGSRNISGWVPVNKFVAADWKDGNTIELDVYQKGDYWNFKVPNQATKAAAQNNAEVVAVLKEILDAMKQLLIINKPPAEIGGKDDIPF